MLGGRYSASKIERCMHSGCRRKEPVCWCSQPASQAVRRKGRNELVGTQNTEDMAGKEKFPVLQILFPPASARSNAHHITSHKREDRRFEGLGPTKGRGKEGKWSWLSRATFHEDSGGR